MVAITTRAGKGSPLTNAEVDANFTNLNAGIAAVPVGDVVGPAGATDNFLPRWDTATGKLLQSSLWQILDNGVMLPNANGTLDIGNPGTRVRTLYATYGDFSAYVDAAAIYVHQYGNFAAVIGYRANGTAAVPTPTLNGEALGVFQGIGRAPSGWGTAGAALVIDAAETYTDTAQGTHAYLSTTPIGTKVVTPRWRWTHDGHYLPFTDNVYDIGSAALRVRSGYFAGSLNAFDTNLTGTLTSRNVNLVGFGVTPAVTVYHANGTLAVPTPTPQWTVMANFAGYGRAPSGTSTGFARIGFQAYETFTDTAQGMGMFFTTTPIGTKVAVDRLNINPAGDFSPFSNELQNLGADSARFNIVWAKDGNFSASIKSSFMDLVRYGTEPSIYTYQSLGTAAVPVPTGLYNVLFSLYAQGRAPSGVGTGGGAFFFQSSEAWTNTAQGTNFQILTTSNGTTTRVARWQVDHNGDFKPMTDNVYDLGNAGTRPRNVWGSVGDFALSVYARATGAGGIQLNVGSTVNTGYLAFFAPDGVTRAGYFGFGDNATKTLQFVNEAGYSWKFAADLIVGGEVYFGGGLDKIEPRGKYWALATPTGAAYTLALADQGKFLYPNSASAQVITIPANSAVAFPNGTRIDFVQWGAGQVSFTPDVGVVLNSPGTKRKLNVQYSAASLTKVGTNSWLLTGDVVT